MKLSKKNRHLRNLVLLLIFSFFLLTRENRIQLYYKQISKPNAEDLVHFFVQDIEVQDSIYMESSSYLDKKLPKEELIYLLVESKKPIKNLIIKSCILKIDSLNFNLSIDSLSKKISLKAYKTYMAEDKDRKHILSAGIEQRKTTYTANLYLYPTNKEEVFYPKNYIKTKWDMAKFNQVEQILLEIYYTFDLKDKSFAKKTTIEFIPLVLNNYIWYEFLMR